MSGERRSGQQRQLVSDHSPGKDTVAETQEGKKRSKKEKEKREGKVSCLERLQRMEIGKNGRQKSWLKIAHLSEWRYWLQRKFP
jgi:hypothetical protein